jgi:D-arabinose 1-dehydrogenase-like Zn-dependent alcohol dehydrogenase
MPSDSSVSFDVFRGIDGKIAADHVTKSLGDNEIFVQTTHSGLCGTDLHYLHSGKVLGHEGVGIVRKLGRGVTSVKVGDRVGFGYTRKVCGKCRHCLSGEYHDYNGSCKCGC